MTKVQVDPVCAVIRLLPVWVCLAVHFWGGRCPTPSHVLRRVLRYGFSVVTFRRRPEVLLTHIFVHNSDAHLWGNMASLTAAVMEFGGESMRGNVEEDDLATSLLRTLGSFVVLIAGSVVGGIGGQLLFHDVQRVYRKGEWPILSRLQALIFPKLETPLEKCVTYMRRWCDNISHNLEKRSTDSVLMCGSSAGIFALAGFNAAYYTRWASVMTLMLPELAAVFSSLFNTPVLIGGSAWVPGGVLIGHAAHVGGFVVGAGMGIFWRWCADRRRRRTGVTQPMKRGKPMR